MLRLVNEMAPTIPCTIPFHLHGAGRFLVQHGVLPDLGSTTPPRPGMMFSFNLARDWGGRQKCDVEQDVDDLAGVNQTSSG